MFTLSRCAPFPSLQGNLLFWPVPGDGSMATNIERRNRCDDPGLAGIDHQELELMRSLADQWNKMKQAYHSSIRKKKRFPEPTEVFWTRFFDQVWKRIQITQKITLACDCCRLKGIWDMSGSKWSWDGTYILYSHVSGCIHQFNCLICLWICVCANVCVCIHR